MATHHVRGADVRRGLLLAAGAVVGAWGLFDGWHRASIEAELKMSQKILYFHAPLGMWCLVLTLVAAIAAAHYLWKRREGSDLLCASAMEVVLVSCGVVLVTGMLWAKPAWGDWFPWGEPRVTGMFVLFLIALAYAVLRSSVEEPQRRARFSSVLAVVGAVDAVIAYSAIHLWNTNHPRIITGDGIGLPPDMKRAFYTCIVAMGLLTWALLELRLSHARLRREVEALAAEARELIEESA